MFTFVKSIFICNIIVMMLGLSIFGINKFQKDSIINGYYKIIQFFGDDILTSDKKLKGQRKFGVDNYVGTYNAIYDTYTGKEVLFGGTLLSRKNGDHISIKIQVEKEDGYIKVVNRLGKNDVTVLDNTGKYDDTVYIENMSYYLIVELDNFKGSLNIEIN